MTILSIQNSELETAKTLRKEKGEKAHVLFPDKPNGATTIAKDSAVTLLGHSSETLLGYPTLNGKTPAQVAEALKKIYGDNPGALQEVFILGCESGMRKKNFFGVENSFAEQLALELSQRGFLNAKIYSVSPPQQASAMRIEVKKAAGASHATVSAHYYSEDTAKHATELEEDIAALANQLTQLENRNGGIKQFTNWSRKTRTQWSQLIEEMKNKQNEALHLELKIMSDKDHQYNYRSMLRRNGQLFDTREYPLTDAQKKEIIGILNTAKSIKSKTGVFKYAKQSDELITFIERPNITATQLESELSRHDEAYVGTSRIGQNTFRQNVSNNIRKVIDIRKQFSIADRARLMAQKAKEASKKVIAVAGEAVENFTSSTAPSSTSQKAEISDTQLKTIKTYYAYAVKDENSARKHAITVEGESFRNLTQRYKTLQGDRLKSQILADVQTELEKISSPQELEKYKGKFMQSDEYKVLAKAQGNFTLMFGIRTDSITALEKMFAEKETKLQTATTRSFN